MRRIYINAPLSAGQVQPLPDEAFHYVVRVLRCRDGEALLVFNGDGCDYQVTLNIESKKDASVLVNEVLDNNRESSLHTILIQGLSKGERMDTVMQKAVELGVNEIYPVRTEFCAVKLEGQRLEKKMHHWQSIITSACEQSERSVLPVLHPLQPLEAVAAKIDSTVKWVLHPYKINHDDIFSIPQPERVAIMIGPEGGFSDEEITLSIANGFTPKLLGKRILRTETAALSALSVVQQLWGDFDV